MIIEPPPLYASGLRDERGSQPAPQLSCSSPGHTRSRARAASGSRETEASRARLCPEHGNWTSNQDVEGHLHTSGCAPQEVTDNTWWRSSSTQQWETIFGRHRGVGGMGSLAGRAKMSTRTRSSSPPRDPSFGMDLCLSLCGKMMLWWLGTTFYKIGTDFIRSIE